MIPAKPFRLHVFLNNHCLKVSISYNKSASEKELQNAGTLYTDSQVMVSMTMSVLESTGTLKPPCVEHQLRVPTFCVISLLTVNIIY